LAAARTTSKQHKLLSSDNILEVSVAKKKYFLLQFSDSGKVSLVIIFQLISHYFKERSPDIQLRQIAVLHTHYTRLSVWYIGGLEVFVVVVVVVFARHE